MPWLFNLGNKVRPPSLKKKEEERVSGKKRKKSTNFRMKPVENKDIELIRKVNITLVSKKLM